MGCRNPTSDDYRSRAGPRLLSIRPTSAHGTADPFDRDRGGPQRLTYPALNRCSRTGLAPSATTASSAAPGGFGNIVTPLEMQQEHLLQRASRSEIRSFVYIEIRSFVYICIAASEVVQDPTLLPGRSGRCRSALRRRADNPRAAWQSGHRPDTHRAPASRVLPTGITAHSFPVNILGAPGSGARRGLRRNNVATRPGPTKRPAPKNRWACCVTCRPVILADLHPHASPCAACRPHTEQVRREHVATLPAVAGGVGRHGCAEQQ